MDTEEFNKLPLDARQFIENQKPCCGRVADLDALYKSFIIMKNTELFLLRTGAVGFKRKSGETGVLYPIHPTDTDEQIKGKLETALAVNAVNPEAFTFIHTEKIEKALAPETKSKKSDDASKKSETKEVDLPKVNADGVPVDKNGKALTGGPLKNALAKLEAAKPKEDPKTGFEGKDGEIFETEAEALASLEEDEDDEDLT